MENLRVQVEAAERATRRAKAQLDEARSERSRISADLDHYETRLRRERRGREYDYLCRKCDNLVDKLADSRARVNRAQDAHAELSQASLNLLNRLIAAENQSHSQHRGEVPLRRGSSQPQNFGSRTAYQNTSAHGRERHSFSYEFDSDTEDGYAYFSDDADSGYSSNRQTPQYSHSHQSCDEYYTTEEHIPRSHRYRPEARPRRGTEQHYTTEEHVPRSHRSRPEANPHRGSEQYYTTEEHVPRSEYRQGDRSHRHESDHTARDHSSRPGSRPEPHSHSTTEEHEPRPRHRPFNNGSNEGESTRPSGGGSANRPRTSGSQDNSDARSRNSVPHQQSNSQRPTTLPSQQTVDSWWKYTNDCFKDYSQIKQFPIPPAMSCGRPDCDATSSQRPFAACEHTIRISFGMVGNINPRRERLRWHPDKFAACEANQENFKKMASEIFIVLDKMSKE